MSATLEKPNPFIEKASKQKPNPFIEKQRRADLEVEELQQIYKIPDTPEGMLELLKSLSDEELEDLVKAQQDLERRLRESGPQNDDELHSWIKNELGINIPREPVCEDHDAPFTFISDLYFERVDAALAMANRGGGKTLLVAVLHWINSLFKPGCESCTFGATEAQSLRCYAHLKNWIYDDNGERKSSIISSLMRETVFATGSKVEVLPGCLPSHAQLITPDGNKRIGEIVSNKLVGPVRSFNFETNEFEWCEITAWHNNGKGTDWLKFALDISTLQGPSDLYCTGGHRLMNLDGSKSHAAEFEVGDELCVTSQLMSESQEQILIGMLLGDSSISTNNRYRVCHAAHQLGYLEWFADSFSEFDPYWSRRQSKNTFDVDLKCSRRFTELRHEWYADGTKRIPDHIWNGLSNLGLACWLMDDGTWIRGGSGRQSQGGSWSICAMNFNPHERAKAQEYFDNRGIEGHWVPINREKDQWIWTTTGQGGVALQSLVSEYIDISEKQLKGYKQWISEKITEHSIEGVAPATIKSITICGTEQSRYDITVPPNANYVVSSGLVISNTPQAVNGPHPQKAHADEVEQMDDGTFKESRNMTMSKTIDDGRLIRAQDIMTSTRKGPNGRMQALIDEITDAINHGYKPPRKLYQWCIKETAACVTNCQVANPELPDDQKCTCHLVRKGEWPDTGDGRPKPRLLRDICQGDFARSKGWQPFGDVIKQFLENDSETFEVQQLCLKPEMKFHYLPKFSEERHCIRNFIPDPLNGPIFQAVDWGGTNPHAVNWYQLLKFEVVVQCWVQSHPDKIYSKRLPEGSIICFDEIYKAEIGNDRLAQMVKLKEAMWRREFQGWNVKERFADPQGKAARLDWRQAGLRTSWHVTREFEEHIKVITDLFDANLFFVDGDKCPMWVREAKEWRRNPNTGQQLDIFNHCFIAGTPVNTSHGEISIEDVKVGDKVLTRNGYERVSASGVTGFREEFIRLCVDGRMLTCTPNHLIYTKNTGWTRADHITAGTVVLGVSQKSNMAVLSSGSMKKEDISALSLDQEDHRFGSTYIEKFGKKNSDLFRKDSMFITDSPMISTQLTSRDLNSKNVLNTEAIMQLNDGAKAIIEMPKNTKMPLVQAFRNESKISNVSVVKNLRDLTTGECVVESVERIVLPCQPVYDLTVEHKHEFYAGGILVHNCMSNFRYAVANIQKLHKREASKLAEDIPDGVPIHRESQVTITTRKEGSGPLGFAPSGGQDQFALWRQRLGQPVRQSN